MYVYFVINCNTIFEFYSVFKNIVLGCTLQKFTILEKIDIFLR